MTLGQKIKAARLERGMTQKELVGDYITRNMLSKIENDSATPSVRTLEYLARSLGLPTSYFLSGPGVSDGTAPDGLDGARAAFRDCRWTDCLAALAADKRAAATDEGYLLHAYAGTYAAQDALKQGQVTTARELAETAQYYNQEGMYSAPHLACQLALILGECFTRLGEEGYQLQHERLLRSLQELEALRGGLLPPSSQ